MGEQFQILRIRKTDGKKDIKGFVDLRVGPITILGIKIIQNEVQNEGGFFCAMPSEKFFSEPFGKTLNKAIIHLEENFKVEVYESILEKWNRDENLKFNRGDGD